MSEAGTPLIRILLIDNHSVVRAGLRLLLESRPGFQVVGDVGHIAEGIVIARRTQPHIILFEAAAEVSPLADLEPSALFSFISASFDGGTASDGVDFIPALLEAAPEAQIIVLTGSASAQLHRRIVAQGARGLLQKECSPEMLMRAIECVYAGEVWMERTTMATVLAEISQSGSTPDTSAAASLTVRERQVIALLCEGMPDRQIASHLAISESTVRRHLTTILAKLGVADRLELVLYAYRYNLADIIEA